VLVRPNERYDFRITPVSLLGGEGPTVRATLTTRDAIQGFRPPVGGQGGSGYNPGSGGQGGSGYNPGFGGQGGSGYNPGTGARPPAGRR
jgi:hypothetical protein